MREIDKHTIGWLVRALVLTILTLVSVAFPSRAQQDSTPEPSRLQLQEPLRLVAGSNMILTLPGLADRVALADETAASLQVISEREILVTGTRLAQTTVHVWLEDGSRLLFPLSVGSNLTLLEEALQTIDPSITVTESIDGNTLVLTGELETSTGAGAAEALVEDFFGNGFSATGDAGAAALGGPNIVNLIKYSIGEPSFENELTEALLEIDPRIRLRRIRVEREAFDRRNPAAAADALARGDQNAGDSYVLTGRVRNLRGLSQALELADRFLGGGGGAIFAPQHVPIQGNESNLAIGGNFNFGGGGAGAQQGLGGQGGLDAGGLGVGGLGAGGLGQTGSGFGNGEQQAGLANWVSRGLNLTTAGGRVVSFLEVDALDQIMVSIRVLEIDRRRARSEGVNYVVNSTDFAIGNFTSPTGRFGVTDLVDSALDGADDLFGGAAAGGAAGTAANVVGAYVGDSTGVLSAIDYLERTGIGRSVAEPNILALTGEQSSIEVGGQVPIPTTAATNNAAFQGFFFQNFGVSLNIRATVDDEGIITLEASPSIVEPDEGLSVEGVPGFVTQSVATTARVKGDQSLVIGGLINYDESVSERKIPVLGDIPLIKPLFRWKRKSREEYELLFVITPHVRENLGVEGEQRQFDLPELDSRLVIPLKEEATPIKATPEGIPLNWLEVDEALPSWEPVPTDTGKSPIPSPPEKNPISFPETGESSDFQDSLLPSDGNAGLQHSTLFAGETEEELIFQVSLFPEGESEKIPDLLNSSIPVEATRRSLILKDAIVSAKEPLESLVIRDSSETGESLAPEDLPTLILETAESSAPEDSPTLIVGAGAISAPEFEMRFPNWLSAGFDEKTPHIEDSSILETWGGRSPGDQDLPIPLEGTDKRPSAAPNARITKSNTDLLDWGTDGFAQNDLDLGEIEIPAGELGEGSSSGPGLVCGKWLHW